MTQRSRADYEHALEMYQSYPMPIRTEEDDRRGLYKRVGDNPHAINQFIFDGRDGFAGPCRILVAGGGTGDSTIFFAQHLKEIGSRCQVVHLDQSAAANAHCRERLDRFGLDNVEIQERSIFDLDPRTDGVFDYVNCNGVLHHLDDPDAGLRRLASVTADDGGMGIWIYAKHGRAGQYHVRSMVLQLVGDRAVDADGLRVAEEILRALPTETLGRFDGSGSMASVLDGTTPDRLGEQLADRFLNRSDVPYSAGEMFEFVNRAGLHVAAFQNPSEALLYEPLLFIRSPDITRHLVGMSVAERADFAEKWHCRLNMHRVYLRKTPFASVLNPGRRLRWIASRRPSEFGRHADEIEVPTAYLTFALRLSDALIEIFERCDGVRTIGQIVAEDHLTVPDMTRWEAIIRVLMLLRALEFVPETEAG